MTDDEARAADDRRHSGDLMTEVVDLAIGGAVRGAQERGLCQACTLRAVLASLLLTIVTNEPATTEEDLLEMISEMLATALLVRGAIRSDQDIVH